MIDSAVTGTFDTPDFASPRASSTETASVRVCHVSMCLATGGLERLLVEFGRNHDAEQFSLQFAALGRMGQPADDLTALGHDVESVADSSSGRIGRLNRLTQLFRDGNVQIVHTHNTLAHFYGALAARRAGVPVVINPDLKRPLEGFSLEKAVFGGSDRRVFLRAVARN